MVTEVNCILEHRHDPLNGKCEPFPCVCGEPAQYGRPGRIWLCTRCYLLRVAQVAAHLASKA